MTGVVFRPTLADDPFPGADPLGTSGRYVAEARALLHARRAAGGATPEGVLAGEPASGRDVVRDVSALRERDLALLASHPRFLLWFARRLLAQPAGSALLAERALQAAVGRAPEDAEVWQAYLDFLEASGQPEKAGAVRRLSLPARTNRTARPRSRSAEAPVHGVRAGRFDVTIVIPVFAGAPSLRACLTAVLAQSSALRWRVMLVDDGSADPGVLAILESCRNHPAVWVVALPANEGYIGAVNAALGRVREGDVLLLNSDCIVPSGDWLDRLASHAGDGVGTVTPFASNGEYLSFPLPFRPAPAFLGDHLDRIDRAAARANKGVGRAILTSVGFCTLITRQCLEATGPLSCEGLEAGYGEEVDFCLRASSAGFEHVAACDVYVTHVGSASFRHNKRRLVKRNEDVLRRRYPAYFPMFQAQIAADPLRGARAAIEHQLIAEGGSKGGRLIVSTGSDRAQSLAVAWSALQKGDPLRLLEVTIRADRSVQASLTSPGLLYPQNLRYALPNEAGLLREALRHLGVRDIHVEDRLEERLSGHPLLAMLREVGARREPFPLPAATGDLPADLKRRMAGETYAGLFL